MWHAAQVIRAHVEDNHGSRELLAISDLTAIYDKRIDTLGFPPIKCNTTRLREDAVCLIPDIKSVQKNRCWSLGFDNDLSKAVVNLKANTSTDVSVILKAAKVCPWSQLQQDTCQSHVKSIQSLLWWDHSWTYGWCIRYCSHLLDLRSPRKVQEKSKIPTSIG